MLLNPDGLSRGLGLGSDGLTAEEREFIRSLKTPKLAMLEDLVQFENQQRGMLDLIEALDLAVETRSRAAS